MHFHDATKLFYLAARSLALLALLATGAHAAMILPDLPAQKEARPSDEKRAQAAYGRAYEAYGNGNAEQALKHDEQAFEALPNASTALIFWRVPPESVLNGRSSSPSSLSIRMSVRSGCPDLSRRDHTSSILSRPVRFSG